MCCSNGQLNADSEPDSNDRRAPGSHRPLPGTMVTTQGPLVTQSSVATPVSMTTQESLLIGKGLFNWDIDYEEKKLLATKGQYIEN